MYLQRNTEVRWCNHFCSGKPMSITYCEGNCHAKRLSCIKLTSVACLAVPYLPTSSHAQREFWENVIKHKTLSDFLYEFRLHHFSF